MIVGETNAIQFRFLIAKNVGRGTYVKVRNGSKGWILAQVEDVKRSNTAFNLNQIGKNDSEAREWMVGDARVIGVAVDGELRIPKTPPRPGDAVYKADEKLIKMGLGLSKGNLYLGHLDGRDLRVMLDANTFVQKHCSVLAKTGSGKSYTAAVLLEELLEKNVALLIIDPHGEYPSMKNKNTEGNFSKFGIKPRGYNVTVYTPANLVANPRADKCFRFEGMGLSAREIARMIPDDPTSGQMGVLYEAVKILKAESDDYSLEEVVEQAEKDTSKAKWGLIGHLEALMDLGIFSGHPTPPAELLQRGHASIIDMTGVPPELQAMIASKILRDVFEARKRGFVSPGMAVIEEAHNFIPERGTGKAASTGIIRTIAAEGRKFGMGLLVISQRPARVDKNVISQCNTQIILRVTNPNDLRALSKGIEGMSADLEEEIMRLPPGTAMLVSNEIERPVTVNIRPRKSKHGGVSTQIVASAKQAVAAAKPASISTKTASMSAKKVKKVTKGGGGLLRKVLGK
jgi:DNA helicase HerA-like ATPase